MTGPANTFRVRPAEGRDARRLAELWAGAFPGEPRVEVRLRSLKEGTGPYGGLESCWVAESGSRLFGGFRQYPLHMHLWGNRFPVQGLASVAVAPELRRQGVGQRMCREALRVGRESGAAFSALFPFRSDFYGRLGFVLVGELHRYRFSAKELPAFPGHDRVSALRGEERAAPLCDFYGSLLPRTHGLVERTAPMWRERLEGAEMVQGLFGERGKLRGYLIAGGRRARSPDRSTLLVEELLAADEEAYRALLGWLSVQRDQWPQLRYDALPGERFHQLLAHPRSLGSPSARGLWFPSAFLLRGPMVRILDPARVLEEAGLSRNDALGARVRAAFEGEAAGTNGAAAEVRALTESFVNGTLPGQADRLANWRPVLGLRDFRLLDVF
ncbi:MAG: GNAT family N-acetyltransferase [Gemmatimonadota bacterium]